MKRELKVLHVRSSVGMYGAERVLLNQSRRLRESGVEAALCVLARPDDSAAVFLRAAAALGIPTQRLVCRGAVDFAALRYLCRLIRSFQPSVIHTHDYKSAIFVALVGRLDVPAVRVATIHGWTQRTARLKIYALIERFLIHRYQGVIFVDRQVQQRLFPDQRRRVHAITIANGINTEEFDGKREHALAAAGRPGGEVVFGAVGRLSSEKGCDIFVDAIAAARRSGRSLRGVFIGDGPLRRQLEAQARSLHIADSMEFWGATTDVAGALAKIDCFVLPSRTEGMPMALLEAMAACVPTIATEVGSVAEVLRGGLGVIVPPERVDALSQAMVEFADGKVVPACGPAQQRVREEYSDVKQCRRTIEFYQSLLQESPELI